MDPALLQRIEDSSLNASAPPQQRWLDGWLVRYCPGKAKRARCINAVALGRRSAQAKLVECEALFREADLPLVVRITPFTQPAGLDAELARQGWPLFDDTRVMVLAEMEGKTGKTGLIRQTGPTDQTARTVEMAPPGLPPGWSETLEGALGYARTVGALRGSSALEVESHAQRLQGSPVPYTGLVWRDGAAAVQPRTVRAPAADGAGRGRPHRLPAGGCGQRGGAQGVRQAGLPGRLQLPLPQP